MKILIVDDNRFVVESLKIQIPWKEYGINEIFGCYNVTQAKEILSKNDVDFLISDIEMPGQDGFALLEWLRQQNRDMEVVLLTSYADFNYARKSVAYKVYRYMLKPLNTEELDNMVREMVQQYQMKEKKKQLMEYGTRWVTQQNEVKTNFWKTVLQETIPESRDPMDEKRHSIPSPYHAGEKLSMVLVNLDTGKEIWQNEMLRFLTGNVLGEISQRKNQCLEGVFTISSGVFLAVFLEKTGEDNAIPELMEEFGEFVRSYFLFEMQYNMLPTCEQGELYDVLQSACGRFRGKGENPSLHLEEQSPAPSVQTEYQSPDIQAWKRMIEVGNVSMLQQNVNGYFRTGRLNGMLSLDFLGMLLVEWNLMVSELLRENIPEVSISELRNNQFGRWLTRDSKELENMMLEEANRLSQLIHSADDNDALVEKIKVYIREHIDEVNRGQLAEQFYLSPSYLSKLFRREAGVSLIDYIQTERIDLAKELLRYSDYAISDIAVRTGYPSFSHFSKQFRKFVGCTPGEYRKNKQKGD